jgi:predicted HTH transcriptional regulator
MGLTREKQASAERTAAFSNNAEELIASGESHFVEFKSSLRYDYQQNITNKALEEVIAKTIAGFMNAEGGHLLIGVDDSGEIIGLENDFITLRQKNQDGFEVRIFDLVTTRLGAEFCHLCSASFHMLKGKIICVVQTESSAEAVYLNEGNNTTFYVRAGNATRQLSVRETVNYLKMKQTKKLENIIG